jgi:PAS domain S-box-containing protein
MKVKDETKERVTHEREEANQPVTQLKANTSRYRQDLGELQKEDSAHILVVDDASVDVELLTYILRNNGYQVCAVSNGHQALSSVAFERPDLILLDVKMPDMDGYEVCRRLKLEEQSSGIPVIFISALDGFEDRVEGFHTGGVDYITKPFQPAEVLARIETHLTIRCMQKKIEARNTQLQKEITERRKVEKALWEAQDNLEKLVEERTAELIHKNRQLTEEIEERRRVEDQLRNSEEKYRCIYESIQDIYYEIGFDGIIQEISPSVERITKYTRDELIGKSVYEIYAYPEKRDEFLKEITKTGTVTDHEVTLKDKDGKLITASLCSRLVFDEKGRPLNIVGSLRDITIRKIAEEDLRASEEKYRSVVDNIGIGIALISPKMEIMTQNNQMKKWFHKVDVSKKPICYKTFNDPPREHVCSYCPTCKTLQDGQVHESVTETPAGKEIINYRIISSPIRDKGGRIIAAIEMVEDITERRKAKKDLEKREKELRVKTRNLEELNTALKVLLKQREVDKGELVERTLSNVKHLVLPYIEKLKKGNLEAKNEAYIGIIESNLKEIVSPFSQRLSSKYTTFTPRELQVANLIKEGRTTKEIAELFNASPGTVDFHRHNIRNKLNLKNKRANLRSYLLTLS